MKEYFGESAHVFKQTNGKKYLAIPAVERAIPPAKPRQDRLLDIGCGNADFFTLATDKGYQYHGVDISPDMIQRAQKEYPNGTYTLASSTGFASKMHNDFDVILICMLFPSFQNKNDITQTLQESKKVLKSGGRVIIVVSHPLFDCYMRKGLFDVEYVEAEFKGYFSSGSPMSIHKQFDGKNLTFEDFHWTLSDYVKCMRDATLTIESIDECPPVGAPQKFTKEKSKYPTYMLFICS